ncbi:hypothetical protein H0H87_001742, partial [Tephrocybe sp. NHM501043]
MSVALSHAGPIPVSGLEGRKVSDSTVEMIHLRDLFEQLSALEARSPTPTTTQATKTTSATSSATGTHYRAEGYRDGRGGHSYRQHSNYNGDVVIDFDRNGDLPGGKEEIVLDFDGNGYPRKQGNRIHGHSGNHGNYQTYDRQRGDKKGTSSTTTSVTSTATIGTTTAHVGNVQNIAGNKAVTATSTLTSSTAGLTKPTATGTSNHDIKNQDSMLNNQNKSNISTTSTSTASQSTTTSTERSKKAGGQRNGKHHDRFR